MSRVPIEILRAREYLTPVQCAILFGRGCPGQRGAAPGPRYERHAFPPPDHGRGREPEGSVIMLLSSSQCPWSGRPVMPATGRRTSPAPRLQAGRIAIPTSGAILAMCPFPAHRAPVPGAASSTHGGAAPLVVSCRPGRAISQHSREGGQKGCKAPHFYARAGADWSHPARRSSLLRAGRQRRIACEMVPRRRRAGGFSRDAETRTLSIATPTNLVRRAAYARRTVTVGRLSVTEGFHACGAGSRLPAPRRTRRR